MCYQPRFETSEVVGARKLQNKWNISKPWIKRWLTVPNPVKSRNRDIGFQKSYRSEICCRCFCQIPERLEKFKPESRGFDTSRNLVIRRQSTKWIEALFWKRSQALAKITQSANCHCFECEYRQWHTVYRISCFYNFATCDDFTWNVYLCITIVICFVSNGKIKMSNQSLAFCVPNK